MPDILKEYGNTLGPLNIPMSDEQAFALDAALKHVPDEDRRVRKATIGPQLLELSAGERADVAWISTEAIDHDREIVLAAGMRDDHFSKNPIVTLNHAYWQPPVGKSLWRKRVTDDGRRGILAKTHYPPRPDGWPADEPWTPDEVFALVQAGLCLGKSVGFVALKSHAPTEEELRKRPEWVGVRRVIEEWMLIEYACTWLPCQPEALVANVSKTTKAALGLANSTPTPAPHPTPTPAPVTLPEVIAFTPADELAKSAAHQIAGIDPATLARNALSDALDRHKGRV